MHSIVLTLEMVGIFQKVSLNVNCRNAQNTNEHRKVVERFLNSKQTKWVKQKKKVLHSTVLSTEVVWYIAVLYVVQLCPYL